jgi:hypothetical protein
VDDVVREHVHELVGDEAPREGTHVVRDEDPPLAEGVLGHEPADPRVPRVGQELVEAPEHHHLEAPRGVDLAPEDGLEERPAQDLELPRDLPRPRLGHVRAHEEVLARDLLQMTTKSSA